MTGTAQEPGMRESVIRALWEKQFEGSPWHGKFHLIKPDSLEADYGTLADKIIGIVTRNIKECFVLTDRRQPGSAEPVSSPLAEYDWRTDPMKNFGNGY